MDEELKDKVREIPEGLVNVENPAAAEGKPLTQETEDKMVAEAQMGGMQEP